MKPLPAALLLAAVVAAAPGCAVLPPRSNRPVASQEGVSVLALSAHCEEVEGSRRTKGSERLLAVLLRLENSTPESVMLRPALVRLRVLGEELSPTAPPSADRIEPWMSNDLALGFLPVADCDSRFKLDFDEALRFASRKLVIPALVFTPDEAP